MKKIVKFIPFLCILFVPTFASAQFLLTEALFGNMEMIVTTRLVPLAFILAVLFFFWGIAKYIWSVDQDKDKAKKVMVWGVIALFVMSSIWGIIYFIRDELTINDESDITIPTISGSN